VVDVLILDKYADALVVESLKFRNRMVFKGYLRWKAVLKGYRVLMTLFKLDRLTALEIASFLENEFLEGFIYGKDYDGRTTGLPWEALYHSALYKGVSSNGT